MRAAAEAGLLLLTCGTYNYVGRWIALLVVTAGRTAEALAIREDVLGKT